MFPQNSNASGFTPQREEGVGDGGDARQMHSPQQQSMRQPALTQGGFGAGQVVAPPQALPSQFWQRSMPQGNAAASLYGQQQPMMQQYGNLGGFADPQQQQQQLGAGTDSLLAAMQQQQQQPNALLSDIYQRNNNATAGSMNMQAATASQGTSHALQTMLGQTPGFGTAQQQPFNMQQPQHFSQQQNWNTSSNTAINQQQQLMGLTSSTADPWQGGNRLQPQQQPMGGLGGLGGANDPFTGMDPSALQQLTNPQAFMLQQQPQGGIMNQLLLEQQQHQLQQQQHQLQQMQQQQSGNTNTGIRRSSSMSSGSMMGQANNPSLWQQQQHHHHPQTTMGPLGGGMTTQYLGGMGSSVIPSESDDFPKRKSSKKRAKTFPEKLMQAMMDNEDEEAVGWLPDGKSFVIVSADKFVTDILNKVFKQAKYASFIRKLHRWGFMRLTSGTGTDCFHHPLFQKNRLDLAARIVCSNKEKPQAASLLMSKGVAMRGAGMMGDSKPPSLAGVEKFIRAKAAASAAVYETTTTTPMVQTTGVVAAPQHEFATESKTVEPEDAAIKLAASSPEVPVPAQAKEDEQPLTPPTSEVAEQGEKVNLEEAAVSPPQVEDI